MIFRGLAVRGLGVRDGATVDGIGAAPAKPGPVHSGSGQRPAVGLTLDNRPCKTRGWLSSPEILDQFPTFGRSQNMPVLRRSTLIIHLARMPWQYLSDRLVASTAGDTPWHRNVRLFCRAASSAVPRLRDAGEIMVRGADGASA